MLDQSNLYGFVLGLHYHRSHQKLQNSINTKNEKVSSLGEIVGRPKSRLTSALTQQSTLYTSQLSKISCYV